MDMRDEENQETPQDALCRNQSVKEGQENDQNDVNQANEGFEGELTNTQKLQLRYAQRVYELILLESLLYAFTGLLVTNVESLTLAIYNNAGPLRVIVMVGFLLTVILYLASDRPTKQESLIQYSLITVIEIAMVAIICVSQKQQTEEQEEQDMNFLNFAPSCLFYSLPFQLGVWLMLGIYGSTRISSGPYKNSTPLLGVAGAYVLSLLLYTFLGVHMLIVFLLFLFLLFPLSLIYIFDMKFILEGDRIQNFDYCNPLQGAMTLIMDKYIGFVVLLVACCCCLTQKKSPSRVFRSLMNGQRTENLQQQEH